MNNDFRICTVIMKPIWPLATVRQAVPAARATCGRSPMAHAWPGTPVPATTPVGAIRREPESEWAATVGKIEHFRTNARFVAKCNLYLSFMQLAQLKFE